MEVLKGSILSRSSHGKDAGRRIIIETWLEQQNVQNYTINDDFTIDVDEDINLCGRNLTEFPEYIQFNIVKGYFDCRQNKLTSLRGCPRVVEEEFYCSYNNLTSLRGAPEKVKGGFYCGSNQLTSLEGAPKEVGGSFYCDNNQLTSLKGAPEKVEGDFDCSHNKLTSLEGAPKEVERFDCGYNSVQFTREDVRKVCRVKIW